MDVKFKEEQVIKIINKAASYLDRPYKKGFACLDFLRLVYRAVGIEIPRLWSGEPPPQWININSEEAVNPPIGHIMFLRRRETKTTRYWTHVIIILSERECIHCSYYFGGKVCISLLEKIFALYDFAPSGQ